MPTDVPPSILNQRMRVILLVLNAIGAVIYLVRISLSWAIPQEKGLVPVTGEPFVWAAAALPILAVFLLLNLTWGVSILIRRTWRSGRWWLFTALIWVFAIWIDFAHH